jgi:cell division protein FtsI (penicillin-binding protein 3)
MDREKPKFLAVGSQDRKRLVGVSLFIFFLFSILLIQFFRIQIVEGGKWSKKAKAQHQFLVIEPFKRGLFFSNTSLQPGHPDIAQPFVIDVPKFHLYIDPESIPASCKQEMGKMICTYLKIEGKEKEKLLAQFEKKSRSRKLAMWVEKEVHDAIQRWWQGYASQKHLPRNALFFVKDYKRSYPFGKLLGQVLHTVREDRDEKTYQTIPTGGLEMIFNNYLSGSVGKRLMLRSPRHPLDAGQILSLPEDGADVYLTINHYLQAVAEEEIQKAVQKAGAKSGWAIMMEPRTGEIFALAQYPWFEPARYSQYFNDAVLQEHTKIKAVTDPFEPGSIMKPLTLAIALKANMELKKQGKKPIFIPQEKMETSPMKVPGRSKPLKDLRVHRFLNMPLALQKSSNVYMGKLVHRILETLGTDWYRSCLHDIFGFGTKTGVELPSESSGLLPTPGKKYASGALEWSVPTPYSLAMGHNLLANSFQVLRCYAILANGGYDVKPTLVRKIIKKKRDGTQEILLDNTLPERVKGFARLLEPEIVSDVIKAMKYVTKPGGSASKADIYGYTEAGKSGTSEKIVNGIYSKKDHISTFVGFAPVSNPRFVLMIVIDEPEFKYVPGVGKNQHGGQCATPPFREIGLRTLQYLGVEPDDPHGYPIGDPRYDPNKADWVKEAQELRELYLQWNG